jgi:hypothetical protein
MATAKNSAVIRFFMMLDLMGYFFVLTAGFSSVALSCGRSPETLPNTCFCA